MAGAISSWEHDKRLPAAQELFANTEIKTMTYDGSRETEVNEQGELWVRSPSLAKGYWRKEELTKKSFLDGGWFRTGDTAFIDLIGSLRVLDRTSDIIRTAHGPLNPTSIETILLTDPSITRAVVCGLPADTNGFQRARAFITVVPNVHMIEVTVMNNLWARTIDAREVEGITILDDMPTLAVSYFG